MSIIRKFELNICIDSGDMDLLNMPIGRWNRKIFNVNKKNNRQISTDFGRGNVYN